MAQEKIGSPISEQVTKQIQARQAVVGKTEARTNDDLLYLAGSTAWVRLSSGV